MAISNGSECAVTQQTTTGGDMLLVDGQFTTSFLGQLTGGVAVLGSLINEPKLLVGLLPGTDKITVHVEVKASSATGGNQVYDGVIHYSKSIFGHTYYNTDLTNTVKSSPSGLGLENFPGSFIHVDPINNPSANTWFYDYNTTVTGPYNFCFISVPSALDLGGTASALTASDYTQPYGESSPPTYPKSTPFDNFITARNPTSNTANNEQHISFETRNGLWLTNELNKTPKINDCHFICIPIAITGPAVVCNNTTHTFSVPPLAGINFTWTTTSGLSVVGTSTANTVQILSNGPGGYETITCKVGTSECSFIDINFIIINGTVKPTVTGMIAGTHYAGGQTVHLSGSSDTPGPLTWNWTVTAATIVSGQGTSELTILTDPAQSIPLYLDLAVNVTNGCGDQSPYFQEESYVDANGYDEPLKIKAYPVPADQDITVAATKDGTGSDPFTYTIYDKQGKIVRSGKSNGQDISVKLADLPSDIYILHVTAKNKTTEKQIIIQH